MQEWIIWMDSSSRYSAIPWTWFEVSLLRSGLTRDGSRNSHLSSLISKAYKRGSASVQLQQQLHRLAQYYDLGFRTLNLVEMGKACNHLEPAIGEKLHRNKSTTSGNHAS
ncbi:hypothetical protein MLD38_024747 [Melastoma candidum]|uniref:Uncharacterized protein n=1 Tax=Melastoma candidum TaxID=119954 RepID=A0ACB9NSZ9_9MYRT|nr:hypothetical protein MLD38_024747 [Melastoma candidum]